MLATSGIHHCGICHREIYRLIKKDGNIVVTMGGKQLISVGEKSNFIMKGMQCDRGHGFDLKIGGA